MKRDIYRDIMPGQTGQSGQSPCPLNGTNGTSPFRGVPDVPERGCAGQLDWPFALLRLARFAALPGATVEATGDGGGRITTSAGIVHVGPQQWRAFTADALSRVAERARVG